MIRREFLKVLGGLPFLGLAKTESRRSGTKTSKDFIPKRMIVYPTCSTSSTNCSYMIYVLGEPE